MNFKILFNRHKKDELLKKYRKRMESNFRSAVLQLSAIQNDAEGVVDNQLRGWLRLTMGYRGIGFNNGIYSNLRTEQTKFKTNKEIVEDHVVGCTLCGETVREIIVKENYNHNYLTKNWLPDNLYLWGTIKVTKEEHKKSNILQNQNSLEEKITLKHYKNVNLEDLIVDKKPIE